MAAPIPRELPVTMATLPSSLFTLLLALDDIFCVEVNEVVFAWSSVAHLWAALILRGAMIIRGTESNRAGKKNKRRVFFAHQARMSRIPPIRGGDNGG
jgi:hypothetical protein